MKEIADHIYDKLCELGMLDDSGTRSFNVGASDYADHFIQPWSCWIDWKLNPWDADIVKRIARKKIGEDEMERYQKIIHICEERIRQLNYDLSKTKKNSKES